MLAKEFGTGKGERFNHRLGRWRAHDLTIEAKAEVDISLWVLLKAILVGFGRAGTDAANSIATCLWQETRLSEEQSQQVRRLLPKFDAERKK